MLRDLFVPVQGNHNATLFLLGHVLNKPGRYSILLSRTDIVADKVIIRLCDELGVKIYAREELVGTKFDKVFVHPWNTESHPLKDIQFNELWIYADGMSNRVAIDEWKAASGFIFWGSHAPFEAMSQNSAQNFEMSPINSQREIWSSLLRLAGLKPRQSYVDGLEGSSLVAMRYWGSSTYSALSAQHVSEALNQFALSTGSGAVRVKLDSRWQNPISQKDLLRRSFPKSKIEPFSNSHEEIRKLGHLASLDTYIFTCDFPRADFFGFDGSLPPTFMSSQSSVRVFVPDMAQVMNPKLAIHAVVLENLAWHKALLEGSEITSAGRSLVFSHSVMRSLAQVRGEPVVEDEELGRIVRSMLFSSNDPVSSSRIKSLQEMTSLELANSMRPALISKLLGRLRSSEFAQKIFYRSAEYLPLRKLLVGASRAISRLSR